MHKLFLDANVLFSAAYRPNTPIRRLWRLSEIRLFTSSYAVGEAYRNLLEDQQRRDLTELLVPISIVETSTDTDASPTPETAKLPEKDVPILLAAIVAGATHLITGDVTHFGQYYGEQVEGILVLSPAVYLREYKNPES